MRIFGTDGKARGWAESSTRKGFTLVELIVVITIMVAMLALAANLLNGGGRTQGMQSAVEMVDSMVQEARLDAMGKGTWSRFIVLDMPNDEEKNLRTMGILSRNPNTGKWSLVNRLTTLPAGFYISPQYSTPLEGDGKSRSKSTDRSFASRDGRDTVKLSGYGLSDYYFIEFDQEGRMAQPNVPTRLVVVAGSGGDGKNELPKPLVNGKPGLAAGIVIYPKGTISRLRTEEQVLPE